MKEQMRTGQNPKIVPILSRLFIVTALASYCLMDFVTCKSQTDSGKAHHKSENLNFKEDESLPQFTSSRNLEGSYLEDPPDIKPKLVQQEQWNQRNRKHQPQSSYEDRYSDFLHGRKTQATGTCPDAEMYIGVIMTERYEKFDIKDIEIRRKDRMQFITGVYTKSSVLTSALYDIESCFIAKINTKGDYYSGSFLFIDNSHDSQCYNLAHIPRLDYLVTVGYVKQSAGNKKALIYLTDQDLAQKALKVWTFTNDAYNTPPSDIISEATDVQVADADGSIYITGNIQNSFTIGPYSTTSNCFVMRVDTELNLIYAKSFGDNYKLPPSSFLQCLSLQITRNADFMYFGGHQTIGGVKNLFFSKSNGHGDFMVTTSVQPNPSDQFQLRRILLDKGNVYSADSDKLYFCGTLKYNSGTQQQDFMYGYVTSKDVQDFNNDTSTIFLTDPSQNNLIKVMKIYTYGSKALEINSDCALSDDNKNLMAVFSTNHHHTITPAVTRLWTWPPDDTVAAGRGLVPASSPDYWFYSTSDPFNFYYATSCGAHSHRQNYFDTHSSMNDMLSVTPGLVDAIRNDCEDPIVNKIVSYADKYEKQIYSWHECTNYWWAFSSIDDCQISMLRIAPQCNAAQNDIDYGCSCGITNCWTYTSSCNDFTIYANRRRPWYTDGCHRQNQRNRIYESVLGANDNIRQFMFCYDSDPNSSGCLDDDELFLIFEQDCVPPSDSFYSIFVARFSLVDIASGSHADNNPSIAAYLGDKNGNLYSNSIALDQYGFVYVHGMSDAKGFGAQTPSVPKIYQQTWVHLKTHWEIATEYEFDNSKEISNGPGCFVYFKQAGVSMGTSDWQWNGRSSDYSTDKPPSFLSKKFTVPKKFRNVGFSKAPEQRVTFLVQYHDSVTDIAKVSNPLAKAFMMNEEFYPQSTFPFIPTSIPATFFIWGYSYAKTSKAEDIYFYVDFETQLSSSKTAFFNIPHICVSSLFGSVGAYRESIVGKNSWRLSTSTPLTTQFLLQGSGYFLLSSENRELAIQITQFDQLNEGLYYFDVRVATDDQRNWQATYKRCLNQRYGFFWNNDFFNGQDYTYNRRFEASYRVRVFLDYETVAAPKNIKNIEDIFPVVGLKTDLVLESAPGTSKYFEGCDRYFAKQQKLKITYGGNTFYTEALPHWITFFERNKTFQFYPIIYSPPRIISLEVSCCNKIEQCATQTFHVDVKNTPPVSDFAQTNTYVVQYDAVDSIGQQFQWEMRNTYFYDVDKASDSMNTATYNVKDKEYRRTDHTVDMEFTDSIGLFFNQFRQIKRLGLIFGQGSASVYGIKLLNYQFRDNFVTTTLQLGYLKILINKMPSVTTIGKNYQLAQIDPTQFGKTTYFDRWFPFLNNDDLLEFEIEVSPWFTDDSTDILTYGLTRSDQTPRPNWIDFDIVSGKMKGYPSKSEKSELLQLKFSIEDQQQGTNKVYKSILINTKPQAVNLYKVIEVGINRQFAFNVSELIWDYNGDPITFSLPQSQDQVKIASYGISFSDATKLLYGKPTLKGTISLIKLRGTDTHGSYVDIYLSIKIDDYQPNIRRNVRYPDKEIYEYQRFEFMLEDSLFYDQKDYATLILYAYDPAEQPLPLWLNFMPHSRTFNGIAPKRNTEQVVLVRAFNRITHDSLSVTFRIRVIPNPNPKIRMIYIPDDLNALQDSWIDHQVPLLLFKDSNMNYMPKLEIIPVNGAKFPTFLKFNPTNRTIFGKANETGSFSFDIVYQDDQGRKTYSNMRISVTPISYKLPNKYYYHFGIACSAFITLLIFIGYIFHTNSMLSENYALAENTEKDAAEARKRFGDYKEIDIKFKKPQPRVLNHISQARLEEKIMYAGGEAGAMSAKTFDYNFMVEDCNNRSSLDNTQTSILINKNESMFKFQDQLEEQKDREALDQRIIRQQQSIRRNGQKTKIYSM